MSHPKCNENTWYFVLEGILMLVMSDPSPISTYKFGPQTTHLKWALLHRKYDVFSVMGGDVFFIYHFKCYLEMKSSITVVVCKVTMSSPCLWACFHPLFPLSLVSAK
jgi:hypothetical protein